MNKNKKQKLLANLKNDVYCRIGVSKIHGVGVIAIKDIPKGTNPFIINNTFCKDYKAINITEKELNSIPVEVKKMVKDFIAPGKNGKYSIPYGGMNSLDISFYLNHSINNNIDIYDDDQCEFVIFITNKFIKKGEELTINYKELSET